MAGLQTTYQLLFTANAQQLQQTLRQLGSQAKQFEKDISKVGASAKQAFSGFGVGQLAQIAAGGKFIQETVGAYGQLINVQQTAIQVFGSSMGKITEFAKQAADDVGLSERAATQMTTKVAALGKAAGLAGDQVADFSIDIVRLGADLAAAFNTSTERAVGAIISGISGSSIEPLREYGIVINDNIIKNELWALTNDKVTGTLTQQQRTLGITSILYRQSADYIGQFDREAEGLLGTQQRLHASLEDTAANLGQTLAPAAQSALNSMLGLVRVVADINDKTHGLVGAAAGAIALRVALNPLVSPLNQVSKQMMGMGTAMASLGSVTKVGLIGLDVWIGLQALNSMYMAEAAKSAQKLNTQVAEFVTLAPNTRTSAQALDELFETLQKAEAQGSHGNFFDAVGEGMRDFAENFVPNAHAVSRETENVIEDMNDLKKSEAGAFFKELAEDSPEAIAGIIEMAKADDYLKGRLDELGLSEATLQGYLETSILARGKATDENKRYKAIVDELAKSLGVESEATEESTEKQQDYNEALNEAQPEIRAYFENLNKLKVAILDAAAAAKEQLPAAFGEAFAADTGEDTLGRMRELQTIISELPDGMKSIPSLADTLDPENEMGGAFIDMMQSLQDLIGPQLEAALEEGGAPAMIAAGESLGQQLQAALIERGFSEMAAADILRRIGIDAGGMQTTLTVALKVTAEDEARTLLDLMRGEGMLTTGEFLTLRAGIEADPEKSLNAIQALLYSQDDVEVGAALEAEVDTAAARSFLEGMDVRVPAALDMKVKEEAAKIQAKLDGEKVKVKVTPVLTADAYERQLANLTRPRTVTIGINTVGGRSTADAAERALGSAGGTMAPVTNVRQYITIPTADPSAHMRALQRWTRVNGRLPVLTGRRGA